MLETPTARTQTAAALFCIALGLLALEHELRCDAKLILVRRQAYLCLPSCSEHASVL